MKKVYGVLTTFDSREGDKEEKREFLLAELLDNFGFEIEDVRRLYNRVTDSISSEKCWYTSPSGEGYEVFSFERLK
jgi:hypothetical protein